MQCPVCNFVNSATSVRCTQCRTTLIHEAIGHSAEVAASTRDVDSRVFGGIGAAIGFFVVAFLLKFILIDVRLNDREIYGVSVGGAIVGAIFGRLVLRAKQKGY